MKRRKQPSLRGSVSQNVPTVRMRADPQSRFGLLIRLTAAVGSLLMIVLLAGWLWHIGWPQRQAVRVMNAGLRVTQKAQFAVRDIRVDGRQQTSKDMLSMALGLTAGAPILGFDIDAAQQRIARLPWVAAVTIERRLPDTIYVHLVERVPMARWQHDNHVVVIDAEGKELPDAKPEQFAQLPLLVGSGAPDDAAGLLHTLKDFPDINQQFMAAVRVGERRWDLHLQPKIVVRLPENDMHGAMKKLEILISEQHILERNIAAVDLRMPDRLVIEPVGPAAGAANIHAGGDARL